MYGIIQNSLKQLVIDMKGHDCWLEIAKNAKAESEYIDNKHYDDEITMSLVNSACQKLDLEVDACLETFGFHWTTKTAYEIHGFLMDMTGKNFVEFMCNVNSLHDRLTTAYPDYLAPVFSVTTDGSQMYVIYQSKRKGLSSLVRGMLKGLATRFSQEILVVSEEDQSTQDIQKTLFTIELIK